MPACDITLSIISHRQNALVNQLLEDLERCCADRVAVVLTQNIADTIPLASAGRTFPTKVIANHRAKGFASNHNAAFALCATPYFCVANPDLRLKGNPFAALIDSLRSEDAGVAGPLVRSPAGAVEDSARRFPTAGSLLKKLVAPRPPADYPTDRGPLEVDWVAGMFMLFRSATYREVGGFDERYFLYYEDVDLCRRLRAAGKKAIYDPRAEVIHDARRTSRKQLRYAMHHLSSALRFLARNG